MLVPAFKRLLKATGPTAVASPTVALANVSKVTGPAAMLIQGERCRVVGRVTMDQTRVDVTALGEVHAGEEAVLIGRQGRDEISATELADWCGTVPWEILTNITHRVPRIYRGGHAS